MKRLHRALTLLVACTLVASAAQAQGVFTTPPDTTIGVQLQVVPFGNTPGYGVPPQISFVGPADGRLNCPMPVARENTSGDTKIVMSPGSTIPPVPMPGAHANAGIYCNNPLGQQNLPKVFVP